MYVAKFTYIHCCVVAVKPQGGLQCGPSLSEIEIHDDGAALEEFLKADDPPLSPGMVTSHTTMYM